MPQHKAVTTGEIHVPHNYVYGNAAARTSAAITDPTEINKIALQLDDGSYWRITAVNPVVWAPFYAAPTPHTHQISNVIGLDAALRNQSGQIKANYGTSLSLINFTASVEKTFDINAATASLSSFPTTTYPYSSPTDTYADLFDATRGSTPVVGRLIENPINGQAHFWRIQGNYINKAAGQNGSLSITLRNPVSGFVFFAPIGMPDGVTSGDFNIILITIADSASIPFPNGYVLGAFTSFNDADFTVTITSITRFSLAVGNNGTFA